MKRFARIASLLLVLPLAFACSKEEPAKASGGPLDNLGAKVDDATKAGKAALADAQKQAVAKYQEQEKSLSGQIEELRKKVDGAALDVKATAEAQLQALEKQRTILTAKLGELSKASADSWKSMGDGVTATVQQMEKAIAELQTKLK